MALCEREHNSIANAHDVPYVYELRYMWGMLCQKKASEAGIINFFSQYLWDVITSLSLPLIPGMTADVAFDIQEIRLVCKSLTFVTFR